MSISDSALTDVYQVLLQFGENSSSNCPCHGHGVKLVPKLWTKLCLIMLANMVVLFAL